MSRTSAAHVALITAGSHGDVQPFVALARGLQRAGHSVTLAAPAEAESFVREHGVPYISLGVNYRAMAEKEALRGTMRGRPRALLSAVREARANTRGILEAGGRAARDAAVIVYHPKAFVGAHVAEATGARAFVAVPAPLLVPTRAFPAPLGPLPDLGPLNRATYAASRLAVLPFRREVNEWRTEALGLPPQGRLADPFAAGGRPLPVLYAFSEAVVPRPDDWPDRVHVTGFWFLDAAPEEYVAEPGLARFLDEGEPPVYVGFGSVSGTEPVETTRIVVEAVRRAGVRAVLATGWGGLDRSALPPEVHMIEAASHEWLFPRCSAVVHHGGSGTTATGLRAGRPTLVCPFFGDQPFWGARVHELGAGPEPIPQKKMTADRLAEAIETVSRDRRMRARAGEIGARLRAEDGVANAVSLIERAMARGDGLA